MHARSCCRGSLLILTAALGSTAGRHFELEDYDSPVKVLQRRINPLCGS